jgi:hypothetical protein
MLTSRGALLTKDRPLRGYRRAEMVILTGDRAGGFHACGAGIWSGGELNAELFK